MGKQQENEDNLFDNLDISGFENALIEVDTPEVIVDDDEPVSKDKIDGAPGSGDPGKGKKPVDKEPARKPDDTLIVDRQADDEPVDDDDDENNKHNKTEKDKKGGGTQNEENESPVYLHAASLQEHGVLPNFDLKSLKDLEPEKAILKLNEHIQEQIEESIKEGVTEYKSTLGERAQEFINALEEGIPFEDLANNYTLEQQYGSIGIKDLEKDEDLQEKIYYDFLALKGFSEPKIKKMVDIAKEKESLLEEATDGLSEIQVTIKEERKQLDKEAKQEKLLREQRNDAMKTTIQTTVKATKEIFPGVEVSEEEKKDLIKMLTIPVNYINKEGKKMPMSAAMALRAKDPIAYELKLAYFIKNGFFDDKIKAGAFDIFSKKIETSATQRLANIMNTEKKTTGKSASEADKEKNKKENADFIFPQSVT